MWEYKNFVQVKLGLVNERTAYASVMTLFQG